MDADYTGYHDVTLTDQELASLYENPSMNRYDMLTNEYLIVRNTAGEVVDQFRWNGSSHVRVPFKQINGRFSGKIKPRNIHQQLAVDMLYDQNITVKVITGKFGTGKDFLMSSAALDLIEKGKFQRIVYVRNNIEVKDSKPIGYLPGTYNEKLMPFAGPLADHTGGYDGLEIMITQGRVEIVHLGFIRGRDIKKLYHHLLGS